MKSLLLLILPLLPSIALAAEFLQPRWAGPGCPRNESLSVALGPDASTVSILFNKLEASNLPGGNGRARTRCVVSIPVQVGPNEQVFAERVDYRGFYELNNGASLILNSAFFFEEGIVVRKDDRGRLQYSPGPSAPGGVYKVINEQGAHDFLWSAVPTGLALATKCGQPAALHIVTTLNLGNNGPAAVTMDSGDAVTPSQKYRFRVGPCAYPGKVVGFPRHLLDRILDPEENT